MSKPINTDSIGMLGVLVIGLLMVILCTWVSANIMVDVDMKLDTVINGYIRHTKVWSCCVGFIICVYLVVKLNDE
jgi:hypothetical protein